MTRALWLPRVLADAGLRVIETPGWEDRGLDAMGELRGVLLHHTAGPREGNYPSLMTVRDGRPDLSGPLAHCGLGRDGTWIVIASGWANHAGTGALPWLDVDSGNAHCLGVEAESTGGGDWTVEQIHAYPAGVAAILAHLGLPPDRAVGHKEYAPRRKIDPAGWPGDMTGFRAAVADLMGDHDMPFTAADAQLVVTTLLGTPLKDLYPDTPTRTMTVGDTLAWAAANAGRAETQVQQLRAELAKSPALPAALHAALLDALVELGPLTLVPAPKEPA